MPDEQRTDDSQSSKEQTCPADAIESERDLQQRRREEDKSSNRAEQERTGSKVNSVLAFASSGESFDNF